MSLQDRLRSETGKYLFFEFYLIIGVASVAFSPFPWCVLRESVVIPFEEVQSIMDDRNTTLQSKNLKLVFEALPKNLFVDKEYQVYLNYVDEQDNFVINTAYIII